MFEDYYLAEKYYFRDFKLYHLLFTSQKHAKKEQFKQHSVSSNMCYTK